MATMSVSLARSSPLSRRSMRVTPRSTEHLGLVQAVGDEYEPLLPAHAQLDSHG